MHRLRESLLSGRRYAILAIIILAVLFRHDALEQLALALPLIALYEISILFLKLIGE